MCRYVPTEAAPAEPPAPPVTKRAPVAPRPATNEARPAAAGEVLDLLLAFFADGRRWIRGRLQDEQGNRCLVGALRYVQEQHRIDWQSTAEAERSLLRSLPKRGRSLIAFNDSNGFVEVRALILKAHELAALPDTGKERRSRRQRRRPQPQPHSRQWQAPVITEGNPLTEPVCADLVKVEAAEATKRRFLAEIDLERVARAAKGDFRSTYILCPEPPSNYRVSKVISPGWRHPQKPINPDALPSFT